MVDENGVPRIIAMPTAHSLHRRANTNARSRATRRFFRVVVVASLSVVR